MSPDDKAKIMGWLRQTDISHFELTGPDVEVRLENASLSAVEMPVELSTVRQIRSHHAGLFLLAHPLRRQALVEIGDRVKTGQIIALLQSGALLLPVKAPREGRVTACLCSHQTLVGYGTPLFDLSS